MKNLRYFVIVVISLVAAISIDLYRNTIGLELKTISKVNSNTNQIEKKEIIDTPIDYKAMGYLSNFFYTLSLSIFIALEVTSKIDKREKDRREKELKEYQQKINKSVFNSIFKSLMPEELYEVIKKQIIESRKIRKNAEWIYKFSEKDDKIHCVQTIKYTVVNISQYEIADPSDPISLDIEQEDDTKTNILSAKCIIDSEVVARCGTEEELLNVEIVEQDQFISYKFKILLKPLQEMDFIAILEHDFENPKVEDQFFTRDPIVNATLSVSHPADYDFQVYSIMSSKFEPILDKGGEKRYELKGGVLPMQGFLYKYFPKVPLTVTHASIEQS